VTDAIAHAINTDSTGPLCSNVKIGTLTVDGWIVSFGTATSEHPISSVCQMQQTNHER